MTRLPSHLLFLWAKLPREPLTPRPYHPLICHMIDVATVTRAMWREVVNPATRAWIADSLGLLEGDAERWIVFLAGSHDIGKASPAFALQDAALGRRILEAGLPEPDICLTKPAHSTVSAYTLREILPATFGVLPTVAQRLAAVIGGHHGVIPRDFSYDDLPIDGIGRPPWQDARLTLLRVLATLLEIPCNAAPRRLANAPAMWLAGLISVADWIGSNTSYFKYAVLDDTAIEPFDLADYITQSDNKARTALAELGWSGWSPLSDVLPFDALFSIDRRPMTPRPLQKAVIALAELLAEPSLVIIEAPMGEGKTEAAMYLADHNSAVLGQRGYYFALPTQATSNQMFGRVKAFLEHRYSAEIVNLQLLHGHAALSEQFEELRRYGDRLFHLRNVYGDDKGNSRSAVVAAGWFTNRKRGLLAPFGVGTIDQVLLAALSTRHVFVRLFGLARKTIIIDEVHAYDTYVTALLERLLEWLGALGSSVVLLSATLPKARRQRLVNAYLKGRGQPEEHLPDRAYPRLTWAGAATGVEHVATAPRPSEPVHLEWINGTLPDACSDSFDLGQRLREILANGGCIAVICNTVGRAQQMYGALRRCFADIPDADRPEIYLLHARYLFADRDKREKEVLKLFGKTDERTRRPHRAVLVATQIIEQSLDLDFDLLVTDFAPVDLILQRIGRLHRHERSNRPAAFMPPTVWVCTPESMEGDTPRFEKGTELVYDDHHVLLRSWLTLRNRVTISIPANIEEVIEAVYDERSCPDILSDALQMRWDETRRKQQQMFAHEKAEADHRYIREPSESGPLHILAPDPKEEESPELHQAHQALTRLAEQTVTVICLYGTAEQPYFDADLRERAPVIGEPTLDEIKRLLRQSVVVSDRRVVWDLVKEPIPAGWQKSSLLRYCRLVVLEEDNAMQRDKYRFHIDPELGLVITKNDERVQ